MIMCSQKNCGATIALTIFSGLVIYICAYILLIVILQGVSPEHWIKTIAVMSIKVGVQILTGYKIAWKSSATSLKYPLVAGLILGLILILLDILPLLIFPAAVVAMGKSIVQLSIFHGLTLLLLVGSAGLGGWLATRRK